MNEELLMTYQAGVAGICLVIASTLYSLGGRSEGPGKWMRRYVSSFVTAATMNFICLWREIWSPWLLIIYLILVAGYSLGYGAENTFQKIKRRALMSAAVCTAGLVCVFVIDGNAWKVLIPHLGVAVWSIYYGVWNPTKAANEEFNVAMLLNLGLISYPFI